ncbi:DUF2397 family protein [Lentzea sp. NPDC054927]
MTCEQPFGSETVRSSWHAGSHAGLPPFAHLTAPNVDLYRAVMGAFVRAKRWFVVHLRPEELDLDLAVVCCTALAPRGLGIGGSDAAPGLTGRVRL